MKLTHNVEKSSIFPLIILSSVYVTHGEKGQIFTTIQNDIETFKFDKKTKAFING